MSSPNLPITWYVRDGASSVFYVLLNDENGTFIPGSSLDSMECWLYLKASPSTIINSRGTHQGSGQDVFNANGGTLYDTVQTWTDENGVAHDYNFKLVLDAADNLNQDSSETEIHVLLLKWGFNTTGVGYYETLFSVTNNPQVP